MALDSLARRLTCTVFVGLCYNIRHFERHGRNTANPFSCRQSAIHQTYSFYSKTSSSVVIHAPVSFRKGIEDTEFKSFSHPLSVHLEYLDAGLMNWRDYLTYHADKLQAIVSHTRVSFGV